MIERYILEALQKAVIAAVAACSDPDLPIKFVGIPFDAVSKNTWLELIYIPNNITNDNWGNEKTYRGILRLLFHQTMGSAGPYGLMDLAQSVVAGFAKGSVFADPANNVRVRITDLPDLKSVLEEPPELLLPISVQYEFFKA